MSAQRAIFVAADVVGYSGTASFEHRVIQRDLRDLLARAADDVGLPRERWDVQPQGDGVLIFVPLESELRLEARYIDDFIAHLLAGLDARNADRVAQGRMRLRVALTQGPSEMAANGYTGEAPILACRLRDAEATKKLLVDSRADLVLVLSNALYDDLVFGGHTRVGPGQFSRVEVDEPKVSATGWAWVPRGHTPQTLAETRPGRPTPGPTARPPVPTATNVTYGGVHVGQQHASSIVNMGDGSHLDLTVNGADAGE